MTRIFSDDILAEGQDYIITGEDSHYLSSVLRLRPGEEIVIVDGHGNDCFCRIESHTKDTTGVAVIRTETNTSEPSVRITLFQSVSKGERMDLTVQKSVELGVASIVPVFSERCVVRPDKDDKSRSKKTCRWQKIALEAARQSGRGIIPRVCEPMIYEDALRKSFENDMVVFPWEEEHAVTLKQAIEGKDYKSIAVFIGPEGGFTAEEAKSAASMGAQVVTIGKRILRTETAGPAVLAMLLYHNEL